jgi:hypothetical protein
MCSVTKGSRKELELAGDSVSIIRVDRCFLDGYTYNILTEIPFLPAMCFIEIY